MSTQHTETVDWGDLPEGVEVDQDDDVEEVDPDTDELAEHLAVIAGEEGISDEVVLDGEDEPEPAEGDET